MTAFAGVPYVTSAGQASLAQLLMPTHVSICPLAVPSAVRPCLDSPEILRALDVVLLLFSEIAPTADSADPKRVDFVLQRSFACSYGSNSAHKSGHGKYQVAQAWWQRCQPSRSQDCVSNTARQVSAQAQLAGQSSAQPGSLLQLNQQPLLGVAEALCVATAALLQACVLYQSIQQAQAAQLLAQSSEGHRGAPPPVEPHAQSLQPQFLLLNSGCTIAIVLALMLNLVSRWRKQPPGYSQPSGHAGYA